METTYGLAFGDYHSGDSRLPPDLLCAADETGVGRLLKLYFPTTITESTSDIPDTDLDNLYFGC